MANTARTLIRPLPRRTGARSRELNLADLPHILWRYKWIIVVTCVLGILGARELIARLPLVFSANVQLMIAPEPAVLDIQAVAAAVRGDAESTASEIYVLLSRDLTLRVADLLHLEQDPEFNPLLVPPEPSWRERIGAALGLASSEQPPQLSPSQLRILVANQLRARLEAVPLGKSRVISLTAHASTPEKAALLANTVAEQYLATQVEGKRAITESANTWLAERTRELEDDVRRKEVAVEVYRARTGLARGAGGEGLSAQEASGLSTQLVTARAERAAAEARLKEAQRLVAEGNLHSAGEVLDAPLIRTLREQQADLERQLAELAEKLGPRHPRILAAQAQLRDTERAVSAEVAKQIQRLRNEAAVAAAHQSAIAASLAAAKSTIGSQGADEVGLRALEREAESSRALLETFLSRVQETSPQSTLATADARIISRAVPPLYASRPDWLLLQIIAAALALGAGVLLALLRAAVDEKIRRRAELEELLGVALLGTLPALGGWRSRHHPEHWVLNAPWSEYSEALRRAYTELTLIGSAERPRTVAFVSALPGDGKTSTLLALGRLLSETGRRVVAVDLNLRKPTLHKAAKLNVGMGLGEWYDRNLNFGEEIDALAHRDPASRLRLIPAGKLTADPGMLLHSQRFGELLAMLRRNFDVVLLDTPPVLAVVDPQIVSALADATVLLVRAGHTPKRSVLEAFALLSRATGVAPQVILNAADRSEAVPARGHGLGVYYLIEPGVAASAGRRLPDGTGGAGAEGASPGRKSAGE